ncbi:hypothetical protein GCM10010172_84000 [Paractinoplanes ferrugineus]|uniref:HEAT repeat domain-containing protein n=1 Tax=Paractinoplanes ferrugineus TaxID=113564 RepID=A0A919IZG6_9ACTN|nr:HEAT repeat domain-containing protein [Actinoplanes ferrugineus]GIE10722.1 hypothetical protein Afe05nite_25620 [Actinoplanes ferrugineus]
MTEPSDAERRTALFQAARAEIAARVPRAGTASGAGTADDEPARALVALHEQPNREVFDTAAGMLGDDDPITRELGVLVLRELGPPGELDRRPFYAEAVPRLLDLLGRETDPRVLGFTISALDYNGAREALDAILPFARHPHRRVRFHVASALPGLIDPAAVDPRVVPALEQLCRDEDADTRFYALYALLEEIPGVDRERVAAPLADDPDEQIRDFARTLEIR